jgi:hypothetical protein
MIRNFKRAMTPRDEVLGNDDLLVAVFGRLDLKERYSGVCFRAKSLHWAFSAA